MATKKTEVKDIKFIKSGVARTGTEWALYDMTDSENNHYSVFGSLLNEKEVNIGDAVLLNFSEESWEKNGKSGKNKRISDISRMKRNVPPVAENALKPQNIANTDEVAVRVSKIIDWLKLNTDFTE